MFFYGQRTRARRKLARGLEPINIEAAAKCAGSVDATLPPRRHLGL